MKKLKVVQKNIEGLISYLPWIYKLLKKTEIAGVAGSTSNADYCYNVFWRHVANAEAANVNLLKAENCKTLLELGPGGSMGVGLCGLLSGYERYIGVDVVPFADNVHRNLQVYDELVEMFKQGAPLNCKYSIWPDCSDLEYPIDKIKKLFDEGFLEDVRIQNIRQTVHGNYFENKGIRIDYYNPQQALLFVEKDSCDWVFSQAVLEHVTSIDDVHSFVYGSLNADRVCSHTIDFKAHGMSIYDNGHYRWSPFFWKFLNGRRVLLSNRRMPSEHIKILEDLGMEVIKNDLRYVRKELPKRKIHKTFSAFSEGDILTSSSFILAKKRR